MFEDARKFFLDIENTLLTWDDTVIGAEGLVSSLRDAGKKVYFHTDNTLLSREGYARKLTGLGISTGKDQVLTSGYVAAKALEEKGVSQAYVVGEQGLIEELEDSGVSVAENSRNAVMGFDRQFSYNKLRRVAKIADSGNVYVCSSQDFFRTSKGRQPHQGPFNAAVERFCNPELVGKPSEPFIETFRDYFNFFPGRSVLVGDRLEDIETGNRMGMKTVLLTSSVGKEELAAAEDIQKPDYGLTSLQKLRKKVL